MIGQMAIAIVLPGFNDLGRSVTPIFLLIDRFLYRCSRLSERKKEHPWTKSLIFFFCKMHHPIPFFLGRSQVPLEGLSLVKTLVTFGIIYATDPLKTKYD